MKKKDVRKENIEEAPKDNKKKEKKPRTFKRVLDLVIDCILGIFFIFSLTSCIITVSFKKSGNDAINFFGTEIRIVLTESMEANPLTDVSSYEIKSIPVQSLVAVKTFDDSNRNEFYASLKVGDVLTFKYLVASEQVVITHRIIEIIPQSDGINFTFKLRGDNVNADGTTGIQTIDTKYDKESFNYILGKVTWVSPFLGQMITFLKTQYGIIFVIILPAAILICYEIFKLVLTFSKEKKIESKSKDDEIEELKKKLLELENKDKNV